MEDFGHTKTSEKGRLSVSMRREAVLCWNSDNMVHTGYRKPDTMLTIMPVRTTATIVGAGMWTKLFPASKSILHNMVSIYVMEHIF